MCLGIQHANVHAPHCHLWPARLENIFQHYLINGIILQKNRVIEHKMYVLIFCIILKNFSFQEELSEISSKIVYWSSCKVLYKLLLSNFSKTSVFLSTDFRGKKRLKYQISWISVQSEPSCSMFTDGRTDGQMNRHDVADSHFSQFCKRA